MLEVNDCPSLNINLCKEGSKGLLKWASEVDRQIKTKVVGDCISLMRKSDSSALVTYKSYNQIMFSDHLNSLDILMRMKAIFSKLAGL